MGDYVLNPAVDQSVGEAVDQSVNQVADKGVGKPVDPVLYVSVDTEYTSEHMISLQVFCEYSLKNKKTSFMFIVFNEK
jgi:hypothetical protein